MTSILNAVRKLFATQPELPAARRTARNVQFGNPWHAVSIVPGTVCCNEAREASDQRHLSSDTPPSLPLRGCANCTCTCKYMHHPDRRLRKRQALTAVDTLALQRRRIDDTLNVRFNA